MTKKDYEVIADVIAAVREDYPDGDWRTISVVTSRLSAKFQELNPRFDAMRFYSRSRGQETH